MIQDLLSGETVCLVAPNPETDAEHFTRWGYDSEYLRLLDFDEFNLHRGSLNVFEYNHRAIRSYEKTGFVIEGLVRQCLRRDGRRWDLIYMGILREEWELKYRE